MSTVHAQRYIELLSPGGFGRPIYSPEYANGPFLRLGDVWVERDKGRSLLRLMNVVVPSDHLLNTFRTKVRLPDTFQPYELDVVWDYLMGPVSHGISKRAEGGASFSFPVPLLDSFNGSFKVAKRQCKGAMLDYRPRASLSAAVNHRHTLRRWIVENLSLILDHGEKNGYRRGKLLEKLRFPTRVIHAEKWAWAFWEDLESDLHFEVNLGKPGIGCSWGMFTETATAFTAVGPSRFVCDTPPSTSSQDEVKCLPPKREDFPYPFDHPLSDPHAVLYEGFRLKDRKTLTEVLAASFKRRKSIRPLRKVDLRKEAKKKKKKTDKHGDDDEEDNSSSADDNDRNGDDDDDDENNDDDDENNDDNDENDDDDDENDDDDEDNDDNNNDGHNDAKKNKDEKDKDGKDKDGKDEDEKDKEEKDKEEKDKDEKDKDEKDKDEKDKDEKDKDEGDDRGGKKDGSGNDKKDGGAKDKDDGNDRDQGGSGRTTKRLRSWKSFLSKKNNKPGPSDSEGGIDFSVDMDEILLTYLLVRSPKDVRIAMLNTTETQIVYQFSVATGCSITTALKTFEPAIVIDVGSDGVKVASFAEDALEIFVTEKSFGSTEEAETSGELDSSLYDINVTSPETSFSTGYQSTFVCELTSD